MKRIIRRTTLIVVLILCAFAAGMALPILAQTGDGLPPAIISFSAQPQVVSLSAIELGTAQAIFTWQTIGMTDRYRLQLFYFRGNDWSLVTPQTLPPAGVAQVPISNSGSFTAPSYRLAVLDTANQIISQYIAVIPWDLNTNFTPTIRSFTTDSTGVQAAALNSNQAIVNVSWQIDNRLPTSNLVFEQIFADNSAVSVELPRSQRWIDSRGTGPLRLRAVRAEDTSVRIRLRVVDLRDNTVYQESFINLPINRVGAQAQPTINVLPSATPGQ